MMPACRSPSLGAVLLALPLFAGPALAIEGGAAIRGPGGLAPLPFAARNDGRAAMSCDVATAHWYAVPLGSAPPGAWLRQRFWVVPETGEVVILNARGDRMPVQELWCGRTGQAWETRAAIAFERRAHQPPAPLRVACRADVAALRCMPLPAAPTAPQLSPKPKLD